MPQKIMFEMPELIVVAKAPKKKDILKSKPVKQKEEEKKLTETKTRLLTADQAWEQVKRLVPANRRADAEEQFKASYELMREEKGFGIQEYKQVNVGPSLKKEIDMEYVKAALCLYFDYYFVKVLGKQKDKTSVLDAIEKRAASDPWFKALWEQGDARTKFAILALAYNAGTRPFDAKDKKTGKWKYDFSNWDGRGGGDFVAKVAEPIYSALNEAIRRDRAKLKEQFGNKLKAVAELYPNYVATALKNYDEATKLLAKKQLENYGEGAQRWDLNLVNSIYANAYTSGVLLLGNKDASMAMFIALLATEHGISGKKGNETNVQALLRRGAEGPSFWKEIEGSGVLESIKIGGVTLNLKMHMEEKERKEWDALLSSMKYPHYYSWGVGQSISTTKVRPPIPTQVYQTVPEDDLISMPLGQSSNIKVNVRAVGVDSTGGYFRPIANEDCALIIRYWADERAFVANQQGKIVAEFGDNNNIYRVAYTKSGIPKMNSEIPPIGRLIDNQPIIDEPAAYSIVKTDAKGNFTVHFTKSLEGEYQLRAIPLKSPTGGKGGYNDYLEMIRNE